MFWLAAEHLNGIGVAVKQKTNQFIKPVDRGIGLRVYDLLKIREAEDIAFAVHRTTSNINI